MKNKRIIFKVLGITLIFFPFILKKYSLYRIISLILGILIFTKELFIKKDKLKLKMLSFFLIIFIILYSLDYFLVTHFKYLPIFSIEIKSSNNMSTYDSIFYRLYNCQNEITIDNFYKMNYICQNNLEIKEINSFLNNIENNYKKYKYKFITIKGKISEIVGNDYISLQSYEQNVNLVEQITFDKNLSLKIENNNDNLKFYGKYEIYDEIIVTGKLVKKENKHLIIHDAKIEMINNYEEFNLNVIENKQCEQNIKKLTTINDYNYYTNCIDKIYIKYKEDIVYDLIFTLETNKITFDKLIKNSIKKENEIQELYQLPNYSILKCKYSNNILIGSSILDLNNKFCEIY